MVFSSVVFLFYFLPLFFLTYYLVPQKLKNPIILLGSILFYSWGGPIFIFVILGTTLIDFFLVRAMDRAINRRWIFLLASLTINLGLLFYFKYFNFFIDNFNSVLGFVGGEKIYWTKIILPIGISFYTFESITYIIDVYRKEHAPLKNFWEYQLYIILFPKLIAGPIVRYSQIANQITDRFKTDNFKNRLAGLMRFIVGLSKKVLIANVLGETADGIYENLSPEEQTTSLLWLASFAYTFQIYFDFSGYSDMALGLCLMMGFSLPENFNFPYISKSITEFWRRWHISLGNWMKNYLYIPLGGNKVGIKKLYRNLFIVFLLSGFWHGASWNYIIWGCFHGLFLVLDRLILLKLFKKIPQMLNLIIFLFIINIGWVIFRIEDLGQLQFILNKMFFNYNDNTNGIEISLKVFCVLILAFIVSISGIISGWYNLTQNSIEFYTKNNKRIIVMTFCCLLLSILSLSTVVATDFNPFIYFRF